jgi:hypothetical protein
MGLGTRAEFRLYSILFYLLDMEASSVKVGGFAIGSIERSNFHLFVRLELRRRESNN